MKGITNATAELCTNLVITTQPTTTVYNEGNALDTTGIVVTGTDNYGATKDVTSHCTYTVPSGDIANLQGTDTTVTVHWMGGEATYSITVYARIPIAITAAGNTGTSQYFGQNAYIKYNGIIYTAVSASAFRLGRGESFEVYGKGYHAGSNDYDAGVKLNGTRVGSYGSGTTSFTLMYTYSYSSDFASISVGLLSNASASGVAYATITENS